MFSNQLGQLQEATKTRGATAGLYIAAALAAAAVGLLVILFGFFWELIALYDRTGALRPAIHLGPRISIPTEWLEADRGVMRGATALIVMMGGLMLCIIALVYLIYRMASAIANQRSLEQQEAVFANYESLCRRRGITAIRTGVRPIFAEDIPAIHDQTVSWLRQGPRHLTQMIACAAIALWIDPLLGGLAIVAALLVRQLVSLIERRRRRGRPVLLEQRNLAAGKFADWCCGSPLLTTVYEPPAIESLYRELASPVRKIQTTLNNQAVYKMPVSLLATAVLYTLLLFVGAIRVVDNDNELSVVAVLTLLLASAIALFSFNRLRKTHQAFEQVSRNFDRLAAALRSKGEGDAGEPRRRLTESLHRVELRGACVDGEDGIELLRDLSANLHAGESTAIISEGPQPRRALSELLIGYGSPRRGEVLFNAIGSEQIDTADLAATACFVSSDGPIFSGSIRENLRLEESATLADDRVHEVLERCRCLEAIRGLPNDLSTIIANDDDRLGTDVAFRLGLARAALLNQSLIVAEEPSAAATPEEEADTLAAMQGLAETGVILVVLPARSKTLWAANQVIFLPPGKPAAIDRHAVLLEHNDAYRHWNYMHFSPHARAAAGEPVASA